tara:strand:- start:105 stop:329 length:225 start_codon:yes stop_codon:yes gene_type:complete
MLITIAEKNWKPKSQDKAIRGEGASQPQRLGGEIIHPRLRDNLLGLPTSLFHYWSRKLVYNEENEEMKCVLPTS